MRHSPISTATILQILFVFAFQESELDQVLAITTYICHELHELETNLQTVLFKNDPDSLQAVLDQYLQLLATAENQPRNTKSAGSRLCTRYKSSTPLSFQEVKRQESCDKIAADETFFYTEKNSKHNDYPRMKKFMHTKSSHLNRTSSTNSLASTFFDQNNNQIFKGSQLGKRRNSTLSNRDG